MTRTPPLVLIAEPNGARAAFSVDETAELLGVSPKSVRKMIRLDQLTAVKVAANIVRIPASSIEALLAPERRVTVVEDGAIA